MRPQLTRRRFLRDSLLTGVGVWTAACTTAAPATPPKAVTPLVKRGGELHGTWLYDPPPKGHYNYFAPGPILGGSIFTDLITPSLAVYHWAEMRWDMWLAESASPQGDAYEVKLRPGLRWSDGAAFTTKDVATTFWIGRTQGIGLWSYVDRIDVVDDLTIRLHVARSSSLLERTVLRTAIRPDAVYGPLAKRAADLYRGGSTTASNEMRAVARDVADLRPTAFPSIGPYRLDETSVTEAQLTLVRNKGGLFEDKVNLDRIVIYQGDPAPLALGGDVDYTTAGFGVSTDKAFTDQGLRVIRAPTYTGPALFFHWEKAPAFQDTRLRWAVAHAIDRGESAKIAYGESGRDSRTMAGMSDELVSLWLSADDQRRLKPYAYDVARAAGFMRDAGYEKGTDGFYAKGGKRLELELSYPSDFGDWTAAANHAADALNKFGIKVTPLGSVNTVQVADVNAGRFQVAVRAWGAGNPNPQLSYSQDLQAHNTAQSGGGMRYPLRQGDANFSALLPAMTDGLDTAKQRDAVTKAALAFNDLLPVIPLWERYTNSPVNDRKRVAGWWPSGDPIYKNGPADSFVIIMLMDGTLHPV
ncbi:MAG: ABC transporter substrate-binding protein [Chloroflexi bacterium]|nr:ABC transporter substrate-binding protein [Chloroflexota bacterium]